MKKIQIKRLSEAAQKNEEQPKKVSETLKITVAGLKALIQEEIDRMDNDLDTDNDGSISADELEAELQDIKDDIEMEEFEVMITPESGRGPSKRVFVTINVAGHETPRESKEAAKAEAESKHPGMAARFAEFEKVGGLDANME